MVTAKVRPTTLPSLKRLAHAIKKDCGCTHAAALKVAALQAGYSNYANAHTAMLKSRIDSSVDEGFGNYREQLLAADQAQFAHGARLHRDGALLPGFDGGNQHVLAGWLAQKANVLSEPGAAPQLYAALTSAAAELSKNREWIESLTHDAMLDLSNQQDGRIAREIRDFADCKYSAYAESVEF